MPLRAGVPPASTPEPTQVARTYCLDCGYLLHGLTMPACPECGRAFDPRNSETFARSPARWWWRETSHVLPYVLPLALCIIWWAHVVLTLAGDPLGEGFDLALFFVVMGLKVATTISLPIVLARAYGVMAQRRHVSLVTFLLWAACSIVVVGGWALLRDRAAPVIRSDAIKYMTMRIVPEYEDGRLGFQTRWAGGWIFAEELGLAIVLCAAHALIGLTVGRHRAIAAAVGIVTTVILLVTHVLIFRLVDIDWDNFHADIFSAAVTFDLMYFFAGVDPYTTIATTVYAPFVLSSLFIIDRYGQSSPTPK